MDVLLLDAKHDEGLGGDGCGVVGCADLDVVDDGLDEFGLLDAVLGFQLLDAFKQSCPFCYEFLIPL